MSYTQMADEVIRRNFARVLQERTQWRDEMLSLLRNKERAIYLWGMGNVGHGFYHEMKERGAIFSGWVDICNRGGDEELPCLSPAQLLDISNPLVIVSTAMYSRDVFLQLEQMGIKDAFDATDFRLNFIFDDLMEMSVDHVREKVHQVFKFLLDAESKKIFYEHLNSFFSFTKGFSVPHYYYDTCCGPQYFVEDIVSFTEKDVLVDCGAYTGDTLEEFLALEKPFRKYIAYELSKNSFHCLEKFVERICQNSSHSRDAFNLYNLGVGAHNEEIFYDDRDSETTCATSGKIGRIISMSEHLQNETPTFIKMDLEGMELEALQGAERLIHRCKPKLAICIYHSISDLWEIPLYIKKMNPAYKMYIRQHTPHYTEAVCYAIPN